MPLTVFAALIDEESDLRRFERIYENYHGRMLRVALGILEECWSRGSGALPAFECVLGRHIPEFDSMISRLEVDLKSAENDVVPIRDENGEIQSFYNILTYQTRFSHIRLVSSENFDAKDNDFIEYRLICSA